MSSRLESFYFDRNVEGLLKLGIPASLVNKWLLHWSGRLVEAKNVPIPEGLPFELASLASADQWLLDVKLGCQLEPVALPRRAGTGARFVYSYGLWFHYFWKNQKGAWRALFSMLWFSVRMFDVRAWVMSMFLFGHLMVIRGHKQLGFLLAKKMVAKACCLLRSRRDRARFFYDVIAVFPFTVFVAKRDPQSQDESLQYIENNLPADPYYRSLFFLAKLYQASYGGDQFGTEVYAQKLLREQTLGQLQRYKIVVEVMELLPLALRGYGHIVEDRMRDMLTRVETCKDAAVHAAYFRACAIVSLYQGEMEQALSLISKSKAVGKFTGLALAWREVDEDIEAYAAGTKAFSPLNNVFITGHREIPCLPKFGTIMVRLVQIVGSSAQKEDWWFAERVAELLRQHLSCREATVSVWSDKSETRESESIVILEYKIVFTPASPEEGSYLRLQLSSLSPLLICLAALHSDQKKARVLSNASAATTVARQVAHDIRSPLAALSMLETDLEELPEEKRLLLRMSIDRVEQIANDLLDKSRSEPESNTASTKKISAIFAVSILLEDLLAEKRLALRNNAGISLEGPSRCDLYGIFVCAEGTALRRVLANLVNNAIEALGQHGRVTIDATATQDFVKLTVHDNGCGIPPERLINIFDAGVTFGKVKGNGLGLSHAKATVESAGGTIAVESEPGAGTKFTLQLPRASHPQWFAAHLVVDDNVTIAVIDDDPPIHQIWINRLSSEPSLKGREPNCKHFYSTDDFLQWWDGLADRDRVLIFTDHEFRGGGQTGLSLIKKLQAADQAILVTSHHDDENVQAACAEMGLRILPKAMAASIPLRVN